MVKAKAIKTWAIPFLSYIAGIVHSKQAELEAKDHNASCTIPKSEVDQLYLSRKLG